MEGAEKASSFRSVENEDGILILEDDQKLLFYQRKTKSLDGRFPRANYVHPLYDLDGNVLTEDFPDDHLHHRGIFWTWHQLFVGDKRIGDPWIAKDSIWDVVDVKFAIEKESCEMTASILWKSPLWADDSGQPKPLVTETTTIRIHRAEANHRMIDFRIQLLAMEKDVRIGGSEDKKGYGGFCTRVRLPDDIRFTGRAGAVTPKVTAVEAGPWMEMTGAFVKSRQGGITILCHPTLPGFPQRWILRNRNSMQNPVYPGREAVLLSQTRALDLNYRLVIHRGEVDKATIEKWQRAYAAMKIGK